jgi:hypothetical protein
MCIIIGYMRYGKSGSDVTIFRKIFSYLLICIINKLFQLNHNKVKLSAGMQYVYVYFIKLKCVLAWIEACDWNSNKIF